MSCWMNYQSKIRSKTEFLLLTLLDLVWVSSGWSLCSDLTFSTLEKTNCRLIRWRAIILLIFFSFCQNTYLDSYHNTTLVHFQITTLDIINLVGFTGKTKWTRRSCEVSCIIHCYLVYGGKKIQQKYI